MDNRSVGLLAFIFIMAVIGMKIGGLVGILCIALLATALTVGLTTGSLAPYYPAVTRAQAPQRFWLIMVACALVVVGNIVSLLLFRE